MSTSRPTTKQRHASNSRIILHCTIGIIFHRTTSIRLFWSTI